MENALEEGAVKQARQLERVRGRFNELMALTYERAIEYLEGNDFVTQLRRADVVRILKCTWRGYTSWLIRSWRRPGARR
jgi:hypothetical protein